MSGWQVLEILSKWPLITRNKLEATKMDEGVKRCAELEDAKVQLLALNVRVFPLAVCSCS